MGQMISLTLEEWAKYRDKWKAEKPVGTKVIIYSRPIRYTKKNNPIVVNSKFQLNEEREWERIN